MTTVTSRPTPTKRPAETTVPELTAGERLAADLRVLADIAASTPPVADDLAATFKEVCVVLRVSNGGGQDVLAAALAKRAATEQDPQDHDELFFRERSWLLPNRTIRLDAVSLAVDVDDIEAAGR